MGTEVIAQDSSALQTVTGESQTILAIIERIALDPNADIEKLERMLNMQERVLDRNAKSEFAADFVRMKPHLPKIIRSRENTQTRSKYAPLDDINSQIDPILEQYGFGTSAKVVDQTAESVTVKAQLWHRSGHIEETIVTMPLDRAGIAGTVNKTMPHATSSSVTYAKRVSLCALLNISTGDDKDGNGEPEIIDHETAVKIDQLIRSTEADKKAFLAYFKVKNVQDIRLCDSDKAIKMLEKKPKKEGVA